jgi:mannose-6-phosphate isomerase-like protein (cupin superfamily)
MKGYIENIEKLSRENEYFRDVVYTAKHMQLVVMNLNPEKDIGEETHDVDQFVRCEAGNGKVILNGEEHEISDGSAVIIPAGVKHNVINLSATEHLKLYTLYAPPHHRDGVVHETKTQSQEDLEHFDGTTSE